MREYKPGRSFPAPLPWGSKVRRRLQAANAWLTRARFYCPVCEQKVPAFVPFASATGSLMSDLQQSGFDLKLLDHYETLNREHYMCPVCGASDRDRLYALFLASERTDSRDARQGVLLDLAPSLELARFILRSHKFHYRSADLLMDGVDDRVDVQAMRCYTDNRFDCFLCSHVLEHVPDDRRAMRELYRILKPGGWGIVMVPLLLSRDQTHEDLSILDPKDRLRHFGQADHLRLYSRKDFLSRLAEAGFRVTQYDARAFGEAVFLRHGIDLKSVLYVACK
jgi:SAM-dependent methyltransferase